MNALEELLREALAERAAHSCMPIDPDAWDKTIARSRRRFAGPRWLPAGFVIPAAVAAAVVAIAVAATALTTNLTGGHANHGGQPGRPATATPTQPAPRPPQQDYAVVRDIPPVTPFVPIKFAADHATVWDFLWFGYVPEDRAAGLALCQFNEGGFYDNWSGCTSGSLPDGTLARLAATDGSGWIRVGVAAARITSVRATLPGGRVVTGTVRSVRGVPDKVWAVSYNIDDTARIVFGDAAGHEVTQLTLPSGDVSMPSRPSSGGIRIYQYKGQWVTAYLLRGGVVGYWWGSDSSLSGRPVSQSPLGWMDSIDGPRYWYGYAPADAARVTIRLRNGKEYSSATKAGWPGSGISLWGPVGPATTQATDFLDTVLITYDAAGHVLQEEPLIFLG